MVAELRLRVVTIYGKVEELLRVEVFGYYQNFTYEERSDFSGGPGSTCSG